MVGLTERARPGVVGPLNAGTRAIVIVREESRRVEPTRRLDLRRVRCLGPKAFARWFGVRKIVRGGSNRFSSISLPSTKGPPTPRTPTHHVVRASRQSGVNQPSRTSTAGSIRLPSSHQTKFCLSRRPAPASFPVSLAPYERRTTSLCRAVASPATVSDRRFHERHTSTFVALFHVARTRLLRPCSPGVPGARSSSHSSLQVQESPACASVVAVYVGCCDRGVCERVVPILPNIPRSPFRWF